MAKRKVSVFGPDKDGYTWPIFPHFRAWAAIKNEFERESIWPETIRAKRGESVEVALRITGETKPSRLAIHGLRICRVFIEVNEKEKSRRDK